MTHSANAICGWQYPVSIIRRSLVSDESPLLTMDFDFPSSRPCNLRCRYCFIETDERQKEAARNNGGRRLSIDELMAVFKDAHALGCRSAKLVGDQEPLQEERFLEFVEYVTQKLGMWLVVFTNGSVLANERLCQRFHGMGSEAIVERLKRWRVSIMLKFHSFSDSLEDDLVGAKGYAARRNSVLERLIEAGFNEPPECATEEEQLAMTGTELGETASGWTRLGLESVVTPQCLADAEKIYRLKAERNLYIDLDPPVPVGLTRTKESRIKHGIHVPQEALLELAKRLYVLNEELNIPYIGPSPYLGGLPCSQLPYGLYVNARGRIYPCCGCPDHAVDGHSNYLGQVGDCDALKKAIQENPYRRHYKEKGHAYDTAPFNREDYQGYGFYHGCPYRDGAGDVLPEGWEMQVEEFLAERGTSCIGTTWGTCRLRSV